MLLLLQKEVSNLKAENQNLKRLLLCQGTSDRPVKDGLRSSMSFRERGSSTIRPPDFRLSLVDSSTSFSDLPARRLSLKYSLTDLSLSGQWRSSSLCCCCCCCCCCCILALDLLTIHDWHWKTQQWHPWAFQARY